MKFGAGHFRRYFNFISGMGQFYVMMNPQDLLDSQRQLTSRAGAESQLVNVGSPQQEAPAHKGASRDGRRRVTHNEGTSFC